MPLSCGGSHGFPLRCPASLTRVRAGFQDPAPRGWIMGKLKLEVEGLVYCQCSHSPPSEWHPRSEPEDQSCKSLPIWLSLLTWVMAEVLCRVGLFNLEPNYQLMAYVLQQWVWSFIRMPGFQFSGKTLSWAGHSMWANILHSLQTSSQLWNCASDYTW